MSSANQNEPKRSRIMSFYQILTIVLSVPAPIAALAVYVAKQTIGMRKGIQALLRAQLISDWNKYSELGYAPIYARENFENVYTQYHNLGANGVMDDIRNKFLALPDRPKQ